MSIGNMPYVKWSSNNYQTNGNVIATNDSKL